MHPHSMTICIGTLEWLSLLQNTGSNRAEETTQAEG